MAREKLKDLPKDGRSKEWQYSYTENGWVKQTTYLNIIMDIIKYIEGNDIKTPVLLFIDGASCHLSLDIAKLCLEHGVQPILLDPTQPTSPRHWISPSLQDLIKSRSCGTGSQ